jgi:hypothetical protein
MTLPATLAEAEALQYARGIIAYWRDSGNPWSDDSPLTAEAGRAVTRHLLRNAALDHPNHRLALIEMARDGDPDADDVLRTLIIEMQSRGEKLPTELAAHNMEIVRNCRRPATSGAED